MKKLLFLLTATIVAMSLSAAPVDQTTALRKAKNYLANEMYAGKVMAPAALNPVLLKAEPGDSKTRQPVYYIYNTSTTFLVIAGDDRAEEILMVGDKPLKDINNLAPGMIDVLNIYKEEISFLQDNPKIQVDKPSQITPRGLRAVTYGPLLTAEWDQSAPYYNQCKFTYNNRSYQCLTGCPATSAAMVMYYWKYPTSVSAMSSYTAPLYYSSTNENTYTNFTYPALNATNFDWANMKDKYSSYTTAQGTAVATLMRYIGQAEQMMYGVLGSGIYTTDTQRVVDMFKNWGYESTCAVKYKSSYTSTNWNNLLINELAAGRPMIYNGVSTSAGGHAFNVDGYRDSDGKWHVNFGWSGDGTSWYAMNSFSYGGYTFSSDQQAVIGIQAPDGTTPELSVNPTSLTFSAASGETVTKTFTVTGTNLRGDVSISASGSYYNVSPTTLTAAQAQAGATVTVTYKPTATGSHSGTITVSSSGAETKTVSLSGTATGAVPTLTADPSSLSLSTTVGTAVTKTFTLTGTNLTNYATLTCSGTGFSIDKSMLTKAALANGVVVTVTYNPSSSGTHTGTVTVTSTGAETLTIPLTGTATATPTLTVSPTSLSFSTTVGAAVTKTFTVTGSDLTNNISLSVSGTGYSIDKTTINKNAGTTTVTVTYNPTAAGTHTGTVTITSTGATTKTVSLNGTATTVPTLTVDPTSLTFNAVVGTPVTKTFTVTGTNLTNDISLSVSGTAYSIDKTTIDKNAGTTTVTVTYNPSAAGTHTGLVTITSTGATGKSVSLNGTATEPVRTITANPTALNFTALVGETTTATFTVTGENLTGPLTLTVDNGIYSVEPTTISVAEATAGKVVTVTYAPTEFGITSGTVTISGGGAPAATVTLNGQADLVKYAPVMLPAIEQYINLTQFRADWTDATPEQNVLSYTLEVSPKPEEPAEPVLLHSLTGSAYTGSYADITLPAPWGGVNLRGGNGAIYFKNKSTGYSTDGCLTYTIPEGYTNATFTLLITSGTGNYGSGNFTVSTPQTAAVSHNFTGGETYRWLVTASSGEQITVTSTDANYSPDIALIAVYAGDATATQLMANAADYRLIPDITNKHYTVQDLTAGGTFLYRVKAIYADGTESDWSNIEEVTLFENGHGFELGDVNHDGEVAIADVTELINYLLTGEGNVCDICADMNADGEIAIADVTLLINYLLTGQTSTVMIAPPTFIGER